MTRIKQFANDMGLSYNEAKKLVNKGRRLKDGGSSTLEKFMPVKAKNGKVTRINKDKSMQAKSGQFKNIVNASVSKQITPEEAQKKIRKLILSKSDGGTNKVKQMPKKHKLEKYLTKEEIKKIGPMGTELLLKVQEGVMKGRGKKDGGVLKELPPASENPGLRKLPTEVRNKMGFKKKGGTMKMTPESRDMFKERTQFLFGKEIKDVEKNNQEVLKRAKKARADAEKKAKGMMGGGTYNMMPRKMSKGGVARGTGAAVKGTGFKGVY